jgi:hypothetical protein
VAGFEPTASSSRTKRATKLRHTPFKPRQPIAPAHRLAKPAFGVVERVNRQIPELTLHHKDGPVSASTRRVAIASAA